MLHYRNLVEQLVHSSAAQNEGSSYRTRLPFKLIPEAERYLAPNRSAASWRNMAIVSSSFVRYALTLSVLYVKTVSARQESGTAASAHAHDRLLFLGAPARLAAIPRSDPAVDHHQHPLPETGSRVQKQARNDSHRRKAAPAAHERLLIHLDHAPRLARLLHLPHARVRLLPFLHDAVLARRAVVALLVAPFAALALALLLLVLARLRLRLARILQGRDGGSGELRAELGAKGRARGRAGGA